jgi:N utilization substance protein A
MKSELIMAVNQICAEKELPRDVILGAIEEALVHAYRRNYVGNAAVARVHIDPDSGELTVFCEKIVVETVLDASAEIGLAEARELDPTAELDGSVLIEREPTDFGRIAAQTAKQVILQRIHEAERDVLFDSFHQREGELISGTVQTIDYRSNQVTVTLGKKAEGLLAAEDQLPNDRFRTGQTVRSLLAEVTKGTRGPQIRLSRTHRNMLRRLLEREVPEIYNGTVEIKGIAREPGQRSKVAVAATQPGVDPVGSCVGMRGTRIQNIVDELNGEKIDVVEWNTDVHHFISNALSPARPTDTILIEDGDMRTAIVVVPDRQLSLAIGKEGQNARLAAKLTGWRIDIKSETEAATEGLSEIKRQQMQLIKARALEAKVAPVPGDDLLSRAEWLLREKDKSAVTLEQAARLLSQAETIPETSTSAVETAGEVAGPEQAAPEVSTAPTQPEGDVEIAPAETGLAAPTGEGAGSESVEVPFAELALEDVEFEPEAEVEDGGEASKPSKGRKSAKKRELVYDPQLGQVVTRKKRKPGRSGWSADLEQFDLGEKD